MTYNRNQFFYHKLFFHIKIVFLQFKLLLKKKNKLRKNVLEYVLPVQLKPDPL